MKMMKNKKRKQIEEILVEKRELKEEIKKKILL
jgi:hypothetical protein